MTKLRPVSRDGFPSMGEALATQEADVQAVAAVSARVALDWARVNKIKLPPQGRYAAINQARQEAGLPMFRIDPRLTDPALPPLYGKRGSIVLEREQPKRQSDAIRKLGIPNALQKALVAWWSAHNWGSADERTASTGHLREALEPHIADLQAAVTQR